MCNAYTHVVASLALALITFSGTLLDQTTGQPLAHVGIRAVGPSAGDAVSDAHGRFRLRALRPGTYTLFVQSNDVPLQTFRLTIDGNGAMKRTLRACSTTLDYHCASPQSGPG
jgi:hypothetical protein